MKFFHKPIGLMKSLTEADVIRNSKPLTSAVLSKSPIKLPPRVPSGGKV
jgi:hypothetical protein